jgi:hypothetical protein
MTSNNEYIPFINRYMMYKLLNLFAEIEQDEIDFTKLMDNINKCSNEIKNLCADTILANQSN